MTTRYYEIGLLVPTGGSPTNYVTTEGNSTYPPIKLPAGAIQGIVVTIPTGANNAIFFRLRLGGVVIFPSSSNQGTWSNLTNVVAQYIPLQYPVDAFEETLDLDAYNTSTANEYPIVIGVIIDV